MRTLACLLVATVVTGCVSRGDIFKVPASSLVVEPVYAEHAAWNDYVTPGGVHGGEARTVLVLGRADCTGLTVVDALGVFEWSCTASADAVRFTTNGFASGRGLRDLVTESGFRDNQVILREGDTELGRSALAAWWANRVTLAPVNPTGPAAILADAGTIYVVPVATSTNGYRVVAERIAIVTLGAATLSTGDDQAANCAGTNALVCVTSDFAWVETSSTGSNASIALANSRYSRLHAITVTNGGTAVSLDASSFNTLHGVLVRNSGGSALVLRNGSSSNRVDGITAINPGRAAVSDGVLIEDPTTAFNRLHDVHVVNASGYGIRVYGNAHDNWILDYESHASSSPDSGAVGLQGSRNHLVNGKTSNNLLWGTRVQYWDSNLSLDNTVVGLLSTANDANGLYVQSEGMRSTATHVTSVHNVNDGAAMLSSTAATLVNLLSVGNGGDGLGMFGDSGNGALVANAARDVMARDNDLNGTNAQLQSYVSTAGFGSANRFDGELWVSGATPCKSNNAVSGGGLVDTTCTATGLEGSSTYGGELSTAVLHLVAGAASVFVGAVTRDDAVSSVDDAGSVAAANLVGEAHFALENRFRTWGKDGGTFPALAQLGRCVTGSCRVWDWRLAATDASARAVFGVITPGAACPASVHGDVVVTDQQRAPWFPGTVAIERGGDALGDDDDVCESGEECSNRFLAHAIEVVMDDVGDDDGLCEDGETCIFAPNLGAYQGEGDYREASCVFEDGGATGVRGVTMFGYPRNGA